MQAGRLARTSSVHCAHFLAVTCCQSPTGAGVRVLWCSVPMHTVRALQDGDQPRFAVADLQAQLEPLLNGLFGAFKKPESGENEYVMKCVMRLITFVGPKVRSR